MASGEFVNAIFSNLRKLTFFLPFFNPFFCAKKGFIVKGSKFNHCPRGMLSMPFLQFEKVEIFPAFFESFVLCKKGLYVKLWKKNHFKRCENQSLASGDFVNAILAVWKSWEFSGIFFNSLHAQKRFHGKGVKKETL